MRALFAPGHHICFPPPPFHFKVDMLVMQIQSVNWRIVCQLSVRPALSAAEAPGHRGLGRTGGWQTIVQLTSWLFSTNLIFLDKWKRPGTAPGCKVDDGTCPSMFGFVSVFFFFITLEPGIE